MSTRVAFLTMIVLAGVLMGLWALIPLVEDDDHVITVRVQPAYELGHPVYPSTQPASIETMRHEFNLDQPLKGDLKP